jgi:hypothetical protein
MSYFARLSNRQHVWLVGTLVAMAAIVSVGWIPEESSRPSLMM